MTASSMAATSIQQSPGSRVQGRAGEHDKRRAGRAAGSGRVGRHARSERVGRVDHGVDVLSGEKRRQAFGAAEAADALGNRPPGAGLAVAPASDRIGANVGLVSESPRERARFRGAAENEQAKAASVGGSMSGERWLGLVGIGEDGLEGLTPAARRLVAQADFVVGGKRHLALAGPLNAETMIWPSPIENALDAIEAHRGPFRLRARQRRSVLLRRRRHAHAPFCGGRNDLNPVAVGLCACRRAARLEPAGLRVAHASWAAARGDHSAFAAGRAHSGAVVGRRDPSQAGGASDAAWHGSIEAHNLRGDGGPERADSHGRGAGLRTREYGRLEHDCARGGRRTRRARPAARGRAARRLVRA